MALRDPLAVYNAANNFEAHLVRNALEGNGIQAFVTEDVSQVGVWLLGLLPEIHKPQVWIERSDIDRAVPILAEYERDANAHGDEAQDASPGPPIEAACEECGQVNSYPAVHRGSVQRCRQCGGYVDVGDEAIPEGWDPLQEECES
jgi:hypothetical protein